MRNRIVLYAVTSALIAAFAFSANETVENAFAVKNIQAGLIAENDKPLDPETQENFLKSKTDSGPTTWVPWEENEEFIAIREKCGAKVRMAAYKTVLRDPLPGEEENVHLAARMLSGIVVAPGEVFSQNYKIGPYTQERGFKKGPTYVGTRLTTTIGGGVCKIASTLYNVTVLSNLKIIERSSHSMPVPYVPYGQDATVAYGARDFKFKNDTGQPVLIWAQGVENTLYMAFYGAVEPPKVNWHHEVIDIYKAGKIYTTNPELQPGEERLVMEGMDGAFVTSWVTIDNPDGTVTTKKLQDSYYSPMHHLFEKGRY